MLVALCYRWLWRNTEECLSPFECEEFDLYLVEVNRVDRLRIKFLIHKMGVSNHVGSIVLLSEVYDEGE